MTHFAGPLQSARAWPTVRVGHAYYIRTGKMLQREPVEAADRLVPYLKAIHVQRDKVSIDEPLPVMWASPTEFGSIGIRPQDLLVCEGGQIGRSAFVTFDVPADAVIEKSLHRVRGRRSNSLRYLHYVLEALRTSGWFEAMRDKATMSHLTGDTLGKLRIPLPSPSIQQAVAEYLDHEAARVDWLIARKQRIVDLLDSRRRLAIEHVILRDASESAPLRRFVYEVDKRSIDGSETLLSVSLHLGVVPRNEMTDREGRADDTVDYKVCRPGDLVLNRMRAFQGAVGVARQDGIVSPDYAVLRPVSSSVHPPYFHYLLRTPWFVGKLTAIVRGIGSTDLGATRTPRVNVHDLLRLTVPELSYRAQEARAREADQIMAREGAYQSIVDRSILLLLERRHALISAAVSGKLQVPGIA